MAQSTTGDVTGTNVNEPESSDGAGNSAGTADMDDRLTQGLDHLLGVQQLEVGADKVAVQWTIGPQHLQPFGIPHGGAYCAVHESTASLAGFVWFEGKGHVVGTSNSTDFLRQAAVGDTIKTIATPIHRGRTQQLWRLESINQDGRLIAQGQVRLANIEGPLPQEVLDSFAGYL